jgi:hypothetical protein
MGRLFNRQAQILIGKIGSVGKLLDGVRVSFDIDMDDNKETNTGKINIYNLSDETIGLLEEKDTSIILKIGYDNEELSTLFIGNVVSYEHDFNENDVVTKITCKDGYIPLTQKKLSLSFIENSNTKQIIDKIVGDLNLAKADYSTLPNYVYKQGFSFVGSPGTVLDTVVKRIGYEWTIANNVLIISKPNESNTQTIAQFISPGTGLIDKPKRFKEKKVKTKSENNKLIDGWIITSLIIPSVQPKVLIKVQSDSVDGTFYVKSTKFTGDTHEGPWLCTIKAIEK